MAVFYVYLKWYRECEPNSSGNTRHLLTCESRYVADEFFRALETVKHENGKTRYTLLERKTPQLWYFDSIDEQPNQTILNVLRGNEFPRFRSSIIPVQLPDAAGSTWPVVPLVQGPDWVHNRSYFIRNVRQPDLYWYHFESYVHVSSTQKTKFRIRGTEFGREDKKILVRSDPVEISLIEKSNTNHVYLSREPSGRLNISWEGRTWKFGDLIGGFGTTWEKRGDTVHEFVTWMDNEDGDEWELC